LFARCARPPTDTLLARLGRVERWVTGACFVLGLLAAGISFGFYDAGQETYALYAAAAAVVFDHLPTGLGVCIIVGVWFWQDVICDWVWERGIRRFFLYIWDDCGLGRCFH
jgi:hypothetical protein